MRSSEAQLKASKRWKDKNRKKQRRYSYKSSAKNFILNWSSMSDLRWIRKLIQLRIQKLKELLK